jgi:hypothetical protein
VIENAAVMEESGLGTEVGDRVKGEKSGVDGVHLLHEFVVVVVKDDGVDGTEGVMARRVEVQGKDGFEGCVEHERCERKSGSLSVPF